GEEPRLAVVDAEAEVVHLVDDRVVRRPNEIPVHLPRAREEVVVDHLDGDRIDARHSRAVELAGDLRLGSHWMISSPWSPTVSVAPSWMTVVELGSSTIAGPSMRSAARKPERSWTAYSTWPASWPR